MSGVGCDVRWRFLTYAYRYNCTRTRTTFWCELYKSLKDHFGPRKTFFKRLFQFSTNFSFLLSSFLNLFLLVSRFFNFLLSSTFFCGLSPFSNFLRIACQFLYLFFCYCTKSVMNFVHVFKLGECVLNVANRGTRNKMKRKKSRKRKKNSAKSGCSGTSRIQDTGYIVQGINCM